MATIRHITGRELELAKAAGLARQTALPDADCPTWWGRLNAAWIDLLNLIAPFGYEDASGFHYGELPRQFSSET